MIIRRSISRQTNPNEPLRHPDHPRPRTRREFLSQGFIAGTATAFIPSTLGLLLANPKLAHALSADLEPFKAPNFCNISNGAGMIPFVTLDLAGGCNIAGSNVMVGMQNQLDPLTVAGYGKLGIIPTMAPTSSVPGPTVDITMGLAFQADSAFLRGIKSKISAATAANINGAIIPCMSNNDTNVNTLNPLYGIAKTGAKGALLTLAGSNASISGGNSASPAAQIDMSIQPTKISVFSDVTG